MSTPDPRPTSVPDRPDPGRPVPGTTGREVLGPSRVAAAAYLAGLTARTLGALMVLLVTCAPLLVWATRTPGSVDEPAAVAGLLVGCLALLGIALPVMAVVMARIDWAAASRVSRRPTAETLVVRWDRPRTWARPLAYAAVQLTAGGAAAVAVTLLAIAAVVALLCPLLVMTGDFATLGPLVIRTAPTAWATAFGGALLVTGAVLAGPWVAVRHVHLVHVMLSSPEQRLQHDLTVTALSRRRVVASFDLERRRIERDLHDGVQPQLMSVSMTLGLALAAIPEGTPGREDVARAQQQARAAVEDLRRFVRAIHPQVLVDHGLAAAVGELADNLTIPATVTNTLAHRPPAAVETNLYYCIAELLTNVVKHADARSVDITLAHTPAGTQVTVQDDGTGGAVLRHDGGLAGIADRVAALGGTLAMSSPAGGPTRVEITVPDPIHQPDPFDDADGNPQERP